MSLNPANTSYTVRASWGPVYVRGRSNTASLEVWRDGALVEPASGTYTLLDPSGEEVTSGAVVVTNDIATYALTSTHVPSDATLSSLYQEVWELVLPGPVTIVRDRSVAVAVRDWSPPLCDDDLTADKPRLSAGLPQGVTSFQRWIDESWREILGDLEGIGIFPQQVMSPGRFRAWHRHLTLALYYESAAFGGRPGSNWLEMANMERERADRAKATCTTRMDRDEDGKPDDDGKLSAASAGPIHVNASPRGPYYRAPSARWG